MKLSIITINLNNRDGLEKTLKSVISQSTHDFEWIVLDGGSTDGSKELIEKYSKYMSYHVCEPDNGIYNAMNKGIMASHGDYLIFLNSGDYLYDDHVIENVVPLLVDKDIYVGRINSLGKDNASEEEQSDFSPQGILRKLTFTWIPHQASFFKRTLFQEYGMYREDQRIVSDWWAYFSALVIGKAKVASIPIIIANYDTNGVSATQRSAAIKEQNCLLGEYPQIAAYFQFYRDNLEKVEALQSNRLVFFLFRIYYYLHRKLSRK
jgi:glycosyltransferase involved in cell wall biosynthesis